MDDLEATRDRWERERDARIDDREAAIETLRELLLKETWVASRAVCSIAADPWSYDEDTTDLERRACLAIALTLLL